MNYGYPIRALCKLGKVSRAAYYKWLHRKIPESEAQNKRIADEINDQVHKQWLSARLITVSCDQAGFLYFFEKLAES